MTATEKYTLPPDATLVREAPPRPPLCLYLAHAGAAKLVGKLATHIRHGAVFLHEHRSNQYHRATGCPAPLDAALVRLLASWGVGYVYCFERPPKDDLAGVMRRLAVADALAAPAALYDGRVRLYPPEALWGRSPARVARQGRGRAFAGPDGLPVIRDERTNRAWVVEERTAF